MSKRRHTVTVFALLADDDPVAVRVLSTIPGPTDPNDLVV